MDLSPLLHPPGTSLVTTLSVNLDYYQDGQTKAIRRYWGGVLNVQTDSTYDRKGRVQTINHLDKYTGNYGTLASYSYTYDTADRLRTMTQYATPLILAVNEGQTTYSYETNTQGQPISDQLVGVAYGVNPPESYAYDNHGNRTTGLSPVPNATPQPYTTEPQDRLVSDGVFSYAYDFEGNLKTRTRIGTTEITAEPSIDVWCVAPDPSGRNDTVCRSPAVATRNHNQLSTLCHRIS